MVAIDQQTKMPARVATMTRATARTDLALPVKLYLLAVVLPMGFFAGPFFLTPVRAILLIMVVPLFIQAVTGRMGRLNLIDIGLCLHVIWTAIAFFMVTPDRMAEVVGSTGLELIGGYFIARAYIQSREQFVILCKWLAVIGLALVPLALIEGVTRRVVLIEFFNSLPNIRSEAIVYNEERMGLRRSQVVFAHPIHYGLFSSVCFIMCLVALKGTFRDITRWMISAVLALGVFLSLSSGALLAMMLQIALVAWGLMFKRVKAKWIILCALFALALTTVAIVSGDSPVRVFMRYATFSAHNAFWRGIIFEYGMMNVGMNPMFGLAGNASNWIRPDFMPSPSIDNFWLATAVRIGIPGLLFLLVPYLGLMVRVALRDFSGDDALRSLRYAWMFCFVGLTFTLVTVTIWKSIFSFTFFMLGAGVWMLYAKPKRDREPGEGASAEDAGGEGPAARSAYTRFPTTAAAPAPKAIGLPRYR
jgi:hypothetical protein